MSAATISLPYGLHSSQDLSDIVAHRAAASVVYADVLKAASCTHLACLRGLDAGALFRLSAAQSFGPVVDGICLTAAPTELIAAGQFNKVPVVIGSNRDE